MEEELGGTFVVAVDELGLHGLWSTIKDLVESRMPLQGLTLPNKVGKPVGVPRLPLSFVLSTDKRLLHLKQYSHSPVTWFRNPATHLVLVSTADVHEYKSTTRAHIKRVTADIEKDWGGGNVGSEWLILYVRPFELEAGDKGAKKVFEKLCDDFGSKRRERVVRLDVPLRAFDSPASSSSASARGHGTTSSRLNASGNFVGPGGTALAAGLDELCAGLRDSIRAAFEARKMAYDAEVRKLHNDRRDPGWSFTMLYLVKDSFALMLEGAGLWEDAFQEYVELEAVYLDCLEAAAQGSAHSGGVGSHTDFGVSGRDSEDVATLLSSSWRKMRSLVLQKRNVQEFQFRQYLFAAQARVLLKLNRPVDVAERGLVFVQNFLTLLAAKEAAGQVKPWFKECWAFSACVCLITAVTSFMQRCHDLPTDWEVHDVLQQPAGPSSAAAQAALRQLAAAGGEGGAGDRPRHASSSPTPGSNATAAPLPVLPASAWQLGAVESDSSAGLEGTGSSGGAGTAAQEDDVPPLDLALLCGRAILPGNLALLLQEGEPRRELMDKLYCCLMGHLYHLARGELLRLGSALQLSEAAAANASVLALNKAAFSPPKPAATAPADSSRSPRGSPVKQQQQAARSPAAAGGGQQQQGSGSSGSSRLSAGVDLLLQASAAGSLSPRMVTQLQELLMTPLCGFSMMINKYADGSSSGLAYEVHTPRLDQDPLAAALHRADSQSTPYLNNATTTAAGAAANSPRLSAPTASPFGRSSSGSTAASPAAGGGSSSMFDRLRRVGSSSGSIASGGNTPTAVAAGTSGVQVHQQQQLPGQQQSSRLSKVAGDFDADSSGPPAAEQDAGSSSMRRQDSSTSLSTVNIGGRGSTDGATSLSFSGGQAGAPSAAAAGAAGDGGSAGGADDVIEDISLSGASMTAAAGARASCGDAGSVADSASSNHAAGGSGQVVRPSHIRTQSAVEGPAASTAAASADGPTLRVATHNRSASALPATSAGEQPPAAGAAAAADKGSSPSKQDAVLADKGLRSRRQAAPAALQPSPATAAAATAVPGWVGEWRLQLALRSPACFQELVLALSQRAAWCYAKAGRVRSSALLCADVAVLALQRGQLDTAASLLDRMHQIFASEGWQQLLGVLLPKLLACQSLAAQPMLPFTALRLLALQPGTAAAADRQAAFEELLTAVGASPAAAVAAVAVAAGAAGALVPAAVQGSGGLSGSSTVQLATLSAIQLRPAPGTYSHFFGNEGLEASHSSSSSNTISSCEGSDDVPQLVPVLSPPAWPVAAAAVDSSSSSSSEGGKQRRRQGAALLVVGDSLPLAVDVVSRLPAPVLLQCPVLSLVQLHKSSWVTSTVSTISTGGASLPQQDFSSGAGRSPSKAVRCSSAQGLTQGKGYSAVWDAISASDRAFGGQTDSPRDAQSARWQEGEELVATKLLAAFSPPSSSNSSSSGSGCSGSSGSAGDKGQGCCLLSDGSVLLAPGVNRLVFRVAPVQSGLYCLKQLRALLGVCGELIIGLPPPGSLSLLAAAANLGSSSSKAGSSSSGSSGAAAVTCDPSELPAVGGGAGGSDVVQMGGVTSTGAVVSEVVVARVVAPAPRVRLQPVVPDGNLPVGSSAWLGLLVTPLQRHTLTNPRLHLQPNKHLALVAAAVTPAVTGGLQQQQQQQVAGVALEAPGGVSSRSSEQQQLLLGGLSASALTVTSTSSSSIGAHVQQQQLGQYVYAVPLQQQQQQQQQEEADSSQDSAEPAGQLCQAGKWLPLRRGCVDLSGLLQPSGVLSGPLLVWMQVLVGSPPSPQATISVASLPPAAPSPAAAAAAAAAPQQAKVVPEPCVLLAGRTQEAAADMLLQLEYTADAGVWRSHASSLQLPLQQPVDLTASALQLPSGAVALSITLSLDPALKTAFVLHQAGLRPQFGLILGPGFSSSNGKGLGDSSCGSEVLGSSQTAGFSDAVPLVLVPGGTAGLSFLLLPDSGDKLTGSFEADGCNLLLLSYSLVPYGAAAGAVDPATGRLLPLPPGAGSVGQDTSDTSTAAAGTAASITMQGAPEQAASAAAAAAAAAAGVLAPAGGSSGSSSGGAVLTLQVPFWLEFPSVDDSSPTAASVRVTLLGPYLGRVGQPVTLCWQLARIVSADSGPDGEQAAAYSSVALGDGSQQQQELNGYEAESSSVSSSSRQLGAAVGLSGQAGSSAAEADELLCYELVFGQQAPSKPEDLGSDGSGGRAAPSTAASAAAAAAAAADMGGVSSSANAALLWGVSGAAPSGVVRLGRAPGSLAVVEVVLLPRTVGRLGAPQLVLKSPGGNQLVLVEGSSGHNPSLTISR